MADRNLMVKGAQPAKKCARSVSLNQGRLDRMGLEKTPQLHNQPPREIPQGLRLAHDVQFVVGANREDFQNLIDKMAMLRSRDGKGRQGFGLIESAHHWRHFYRLRARADDDGDAMSHMSVYWTGRAEYPPPRRRPTATIYGLSQQSRKSVAADVRRRIFGRYPRVCPPPYVGGYGSGT